MNKNRQGHCPIFQQPNNFQCTSNDKCLIYGVLCDPSAIFISFLFIFDIYSSYSYKRNVAVKYNCYWSFFFYICVETEKGSDGACQNICVHWCFICMIICAPIWFYFFIYNIFVLLLLFVKHNKTNFFLGCSDIKIY